MSNVSQETSSQENVRSCACGNPIDGKGKQCPECHRLYMREWRAGYVTRRLAPEEWALIVNLRAEAEHRGRGRHRAPVPPQRRNAAGRLVGRPRIADSDVELPPGLAELVLVGFDLAEGRESA